MIKNVPNLSFISQCDLTMFQEENKSDDEFDTRISGPWMKRWPITHHNQHTAHAGIIPPT